MADIYMHAENVETTIDLPSYLKKEDYYKDKKLLMLVIKKMQWHRSIRRTR